MALLFPFASPSLSYTTFGWCRNVIVSCYKQSSATDTILELTLTVVANISDGEDGADMKWKADEKEEFPLIHTIVHCTDTRHLLLATVYDLCMTKCAHKCIYLYYSLNAQLRAHTHTLSNSFIKREKCTFSDTHSAEQHCIKVAVVPLLTTLNTQFSVSPSSPESPASFSFFYHTSFSTHSVLHFLLIFHSFPCSFSLAIYSL